MLLSLGEAAGYISLVINLHRNSEFGGLAPLVRFALAGRCFLAANLARRGRLLDWSNVVAMLWGVIDGLIFNGKSYIILGVAPYIVAIVAGGRRRYFRSVVTVGGLITLIAFDQLLFPVIHAMRSTDYRTSSMAQRAESIAKVATDPNNRIESEIENPDDITNEGDRFMKTRSIGLQRAAAVEYLDTTLEFGEPSVTKMTWLEFGRQCIRDALPQQLSPNKRYVQYADLLWQAIYPDYAGQNTTMGGLASSRLLFGTWIGAAVFVATIVIIVKLYEVFYGSDCRRPLVQFIWLLNCLALVETDIEAWGVILLRMFWQDLVILVLVGYLAEKVREIIWRLSPAGSRV
jgi:hypothetical protein